MDYNFAPPSTTSIYLSATTFYSSSASPIVPNTCVIILVGEYMCTFIQ